MKGIRYKGSSKSGFALIVVAFLISIMLLIGAAMVSLMQVESAATQYEMRLRMARDNARYALNIALGELQQHAGRDQAITATADGFNLDTDSDFKEVVDPATTGVYEPFWTGVWDNNPATNDDPVWLVTKSAGTDFNGTEDGEEADPLIEQYDRSVILVGPGTAVNADSAKQADFNVTVPLEEIQAESILGQSSEATIGRYGYWVGDLGVKASYGLQDRIDDVQHDEYDTSGGDNGLQTRLRQMSGPVYPFAEDDDFSTWDLDTVTNLIRFPNLVSDHQLRTENTGGGLLVENASKTAVLERFHDYTLLSRSVFTNTLEGGLKIDLSANEDVGESFADDFLLPYANSGGFVTDSPTDESRVYSIESYDAASNRPGLSPVVTGFTINFALTIDRIVGSPSENRLIVHPNVGIELWNPYSSSLALEELKLTVLDLPRFTFKYVSNGVESTEYSVDLNEVLPANVFSVNLGGTPGGVLRAGQIAVYRGGDTLEWGIGWTEERGEFEVTNAAVGDFSDDTIGDLSDDYTKLFSIEAATPRVELRNAANESLYISNVVKPLGDWFNASTGEVLSVSWDDDMSRFGYTWEFEDPWIPASAGDYDPWFDFDPRNGEIRSGMMVPSASAPQDYRNRAHSFQDTEVSGNLFAHNPSVAGGGSSVETLYDIPYFSLPRQHVLSVSELVDVQVLPAFRWQLGRSIDDLGGTNSVNAAMDQYFFSTVPVDGSTATSWTLDDPLPNNRIEPFRAESVAALQTKDSASSLLLRGGFNLNSTSLDAWTLLLKEISLGDWSNAHESSPESFGSGNFQFLRFSQSAEETWESLHDDVDAPSLKERKSFRNVIFSLSEAQIDELALEIVKRIRVKMDLDGPFTGLAELMDSGILNAAILAVGDVSSEINPSYVPKYAPGYFDQVALLNAVSHVLSARSDTFLIRSYGETANPYDSSEVWAKAYCEAIVQRLPSKHSSDANTGEAMSPTSLGSGEFGRQFEILSFRWLLPEEI